MGFGLASPRGSPPPVRQGQAMTMLPRDYTCSLARLNAEASQHPNVVK